MVESLLLLIKDAVSAGNLAQPQALVALALLVALVAVFKIKA